MNEKLKKIIADLIKKDADKLMLSDDVVLTKDLEFDSILVIQLIVELENQFGIEFTDDDLDLDKLTIYGKLKETVESKISLMNTN
ncbi:MAG: Phosphopantetheine attachment site [Herbinix sp.]|jgi:acyl carrier protein|nr:Phosphopantetheine attachment site [Herbinix sp.]